MKLLLTGLVGLLFGIALTHYFSAPDTTSQNTDTAQLVKPLYWVAPMDANYRRDKPGKSPMGMDLIPVYAQDTTPAPQAGVVKISPDVVHNLGVRTGFVTRQTIQEPINTVGYVGYNQDSLLHIHPRVEGWVDTLYIKSSGQKVVQGEPLYALYSPQLVNAQEEYLLARNRQNSSLSAAALERLKALQMPVDSINQLNKTGKVLQTVIFKAPQSGVVDNLNIREGFFVKPGTTLLSIGALDEVWVEAEVFERQASLVKEGLTATMTLGFLPAEVWQGKLDYIYPTLDAMTRTLRIRLRFANPQGQLKPNMFANIIIASEPQPDLLVVPKEAVIRTGLQDRVVMVLGDGQFKSVAVQTGLISSDTIQILSGLAQGDHVVTSAQFLLDSESSIDSDFKRLFHPIDEPQMHAMEPQVSTTSAIQQATVKGQILQIDSSQRRLTIYREAIKKWQRPAATMEFSLSDNVKPDGLYEQQQVSFSFEIRDGDFVITHIEPDHSSHKNMESQP